MNRLLCYRDILGRWSLERRQQAQSDLKQKDNNETYKIHNFGVKLHFVPATIMEGRVYWWWYLWKF